ncbi:MAG TPA: flagellar motor switch protein FliM [Anaerolineae bacterium]|nr:flagellar motor switch protein FliM [Anaerolineae bacterium]
MAGMLTQDEINALLSTAPGDGLTTIKEDSARVSLDAKHIQVHNFRHLSTFSEGHLGAVGFIYEAFLRYLEAALLSYTRQDMSFSIASVEQLPFEKYRGALQNPSSLVVFTIQGLPGRAILELSPELTFLILEKLLGGAGDRSSAMARCLTEIERGVIGKAAKKILVAFSTACSKIHDGEPVVEALTTSPEFLQVIPPHEITEVAVFEVVVEDAIATMSICLPHVMLEPLMPKAGQAERSATSGRANSDVPGGVRIAKTLNRVSLPVSVELGRAKISIKRLLQLKPGDVIRLDTPADSDIRVLVNGRVKFYARPGVMGERVAVKTTGIAD